MIKARKVRKNGFERPFSALQLLSWVLAALLLASFATVTACLLVSEKDNKVVTLAIAVLYAIAYAAMVTTTIIVTKSDPTDPATLLERAYRASQAQGS